MLFTTPINTKEIDSLRVRIRCRKLMCGSLFLFACGERVLVVSRGVSDTCRVSHVSPWVTTPPLPCGSHWYVGDNINIWESVTNGTEWNIPIIKCPVSFILSFYRWLEYLIGSLTTYLYSRRAGWIGSKHCQYPIKQKRAFLVDWENSYERVFRLTFEGAHVHCPSMNHGRNLQTNAHGINPWDSTGDNTVSVGCLLLDEIHPVIGYNELVFGQNNRTKG